MVLLQINSCANSGSTGRITEEIGQLAIDNGWESYIAYGRNARESKSQLIQIGGKLDFYEHALETRLLDNHGLASRCATKRFIEQIKKIQPDIIHLHNIHGYYVNIEILFNYLAQAHIPVVWTLHDCWSFTGHCSHFSVAGCGRWKTGCNNCPQKKAYPGSWLWDRSSRNYQLKKHLFTSLHDRLTVVTVSDWLNRLLDDSFFYKTSKLTIHNGIDLSAFKQKSDHNIRNKFGLNNKFLLVAAATSWTQRKGLNDYYELSKLLPPDCVIMLVGLSPKQIKQLPLNIIGLKKTESIAELVAIYSAADVVLNLSYEETFGLTTIEGFACGVPGIVYNKTASPELIDENTGFVVEAQNYPQLLDAIKQIQQNGKSHYSAACRERAERLYNKDDRYAEYINLYAEYINLYAEYINLYHNDGHISVSQSKN